MDPKEVQSALSKYVGGTIETDFFSSTDEPLLGEITDLKLEPDRRMLHIRCCLVREYSVEENYNIQFVAPSSTIKVVLPPSTLDLIRHGRDIWMDVVMKHSGNPDRFVSLSVLKSPLNFNKLVPTNQNDH